MEPYDGIRALTKDPSSLRHPFHQVNLLGCLWIREWALTRLRICQHQPPELWETHLSLVSYSLVCGVFAAVTLRQTEAPRALIVPCFLKSRIHLCEAALPPFSSPSTPCQIQFGNIICVFLFYFPRHQISRSFRPWSNTQLLRLATLVKNNFTWCQEGSMPRTSPLHPATTFGTCVAPSHISCLERSHIQAGKTKRVWNKKGGPSSCCLFSAVFKYLGHAFRDENNTVTQFCRVRALTFNADTENSSNPSSKVDRLQVSYVFYTSIFSRSAFMESSKHILNSLLSVKRR